MAVNVNKTKFIIFHTRGKKVDLDAKKIIFDNNDPSSPFNPDIVCWLERIHNNHTDPSSRSCKLLGILLDEHLTFHQHFDYLKSKLSKALFCINRVKNFLPQKTLTTIYQSLFHSHLQYCPIIVNSTSKFHNSCRTGAASSGRIRNNSVQIWRAVRYEVKRFCTELKLDLIPI